MSPREQQLRIRLRARLARRTPGQDRWPVRATAVRLGRRAEEDVAERAAPSESLRIPTRVRITPLRTIDPAPNAPLLMRLVREPFALAGVRPQRRPSHRERPSRAAINAPRAPEIVSEAREIVAFANPVREHGHRPSFRPHPFSRARLVAEEER